MSDEDEVTLTLADVGDDTEFDEQWDAWRTKEVIPIRRDHLRTICHLWFNLGVARGTAWASDEFDRKTQ